VWITYLADKLKAGVMIACPGVSGANGFAAASSWGPAALKHPVYPSSNASSQFSTKAVSPQTFKLVWQLNHTPTSFL
tara:strand:+ start:313 stop:543 length:231 start_codon:yes stop_codon:yes gene_type:complete